GLASFNAGATNNITLNQIGNNFSSVSIVSGKDVVVFDTNALTLDASTISGNLTATANAGSLTTANTISLGGTTHVLNAVGATSDITVGGNITHNNAAASTLTLRADNSVLFTASGNVTATGAALD